ncbi:protein FAM47E isoform X1 [Phyllostomus discolor]|uniref:Protein FAM47E isoform X1 n=2 Tax=Phyllostomus discolor TaxID=89673 RepID=A0A7E6DHF2_9CHIR|nr:protein FAM47E isoform X1 [Phyllostomus discolor]
MPQLKVPVTGNTKMVEGSRSGEERDPKTSPKRTSLSPQGTLLYEKKKSNEMDSLHEDGSPLCENARRAVNDFCQWTGDITSVKIDEEFVMKQFHLDCQSKPSCYGLSMMRLDQLPLQLKKSIRLNKWQEAEFFKERERKLENPSKPKYVKMRYGAWYLDPKLWKMQRADEPLVDPKVLRKAQDELLKKQQQEQEELLSFAKLYGPAAFKEFILRKGYRMPSFLEKINVRKDVNASVKRVL